uniref:Uncharacterized protein n=1 Tax=uncultured Thiotrichaceae bacterium TaxID=298394 RepID=A0A6S6TH24_9GAMM|nr:MAG: Unknown protein [uncultured Thiotrichaceae bacterium]
MSKPITSTTATPITFEQRLQLVKAEAQARVSACPAEQQNGVRARLWVNWMNRNLLEVA